MRDPNVGATRRGAHLHPHCETAPDAGIAPTDVAVESDALQLHP